MTPLLLLALLLPLPTPVSAFASSTFRHTFKFPAIAYKVGVRHIHCPEYWACYKPAVVPGFELVRVGRPVQVANYSTIEFDIHTLMGDTHARMLTSCETRSHLLLSREDKPTGADLPFCAVRFDVEREGAVGHSVTVRGQTWGEPTVWARLLLGVMLQAHMWEATLAWACLRRDENPNLKLYRDRVLLRRPSPGEDE